ncbi:cation transporter [Luoshenia tenuis]|jgi:divalent metal cation (Fe/Co/Zn/Cd) transporter|uniref:cation transporter n=1 Tax=Luoshenia tenuis TaxID=2763654 RepID=UPI003D8F4D0D
MGDRHMVGGIRLLALTVAVWVVLAATAGYMAGSLGLVGMALVGVEGVLAPLACVYWQARAEKEARRRTEYGALGALVIGALGVLFCTLLMIAAIRRLGAVHMPVPLAFSVPLALLMLAGIECGYRCLRCAARRRQSAVLRGEALDRRARLPLAVFALAGTIGEQYGLAWADLIAGLALSLYAAGRLLLAMRAILKRESTGWIKEIVQLARACDISQPPRRICIRWDGQYADIDLSSPTGPSGSHMVKANFMGRCALFSLRKGD